MKESAHILIVDDLLSMRVVAKRALKELGFSTFDEAGDGEKAWNLIKQKALGGSPYDLIVTDWDMPKMNGLQLLHNIKTDDWCKKTPVLFLAADAGDEIKNKVVEMGALGFLVRPFKTEDLKAQIESV